MKPRSRACVQEIVGVLIGDVRGFRKEARRSTVRRMLRTIGLMSGTSLDGVDAAWVETDGERDRPARPDADAAL